MATHDYNIANQGFPAFRADLNNALSAIVSNNSSATEPATTFAYQWWMDTAADPSILKVRNADNDAWITLGTFNQTADTFTPAGVTSDKIEEGNSKVEVVDTGTGHILFQVDGAEVARFNPDQLVTKAGTASTPAVSPTGDLNTGIFFPAADTIGLAAGGVEAARLVSGLLSVPANSTAASAVRLYEDTDNGTNYVDIVAPSAITSDRTITLPDNTGTIITTASTFAGTGPAFSAYLTNDQTVTDAVTTKITFDTEEFDTASCFASSSFTPNVAGYYYVLTSLTHRQTNITDAVLLIYKNGSTFKRSSEWFDASSTQDNLAMSGACLVYMNGSTDYLEVYLYSDGTGNATEIGGSQNTYFQGYLARAA